MSRGDDTSRGEGASFSMGPAECVWMAPCVGREIPRASESSGSTSSAPGVCARPEGTTASNLGMNPGAPESAPETAPERAPERAPESSA